MLATSHLFQKASSWTWQFFWKETKEDIDSMILEVHKEWVIVFYHWVIQSAILDHNANVERVFSLIAQQ